MSDPRILCIRHGESTFNAAYANDGVDPMLFDAPLTERGHAQVEAARLQLRDTPVDVVLTTPLTRAMQTSLGIFSQHPSRPAIIVETLHRERLESSCDQGRSPDLLMAEFPTLTLDHLPATWWHAEGEPDGRGITVEPLEVMMARMEQFVTALKTRREATIALVGHGTFFHHLTGRWLANCEVMEWHWDHPRVPAGD
ncbi:histidine phosphatase family protein [Lichenihabitans sp. PAMC28606]|uniref:histidine phosphatase family protein n=1 Tax=Lichenihabitans sp. PAMC28606 TaxID=2880932 RepID=UPI001D0B0009|nr:histidine phosphatase family protein [Lichenihabitans sp. PAMC28606]UDL93612.1 histidine phosphatase family protein [Lichenihabitans sp. PAMC28606]